MGKEEKYQEVNKDLQEINEIKKQNTAHPGV